MKLLAVDTSTTVCNVCLTEGNTLVAEYCTRSEVTHTERLMPAIELLFSHIDWPIADLDGLAVIHGPGSFTGLRIGLSVVKGLSYALNLPVVALNALEVAAHQMPVSGLIAPAMDARRSEIFTALYRRDGTALTEIIGPQSIRPEIWKKELPDERVFFCGPGSSLYFESIKNHPESTVLFEDFILAKTLSRLAYHRFLSGDVIAGGELKAAYLRPSDAESKPRNQSNKQVYQR